MNFIFGRKKRDRQIFIIPEEEGAVEKDETFSKQLPVQFQPSQWTKCKANDFSPRSGHKAVSFGNQIFVFGGCQKASHFFFFPAGIEVFDIERKKWLKRYTSGEKPIGRASFAMCKTSDSSFIVAGGIRRNNQVLGDMFQYHIHNSKWEQLQCNLHDSPCKFYGQTVSSYGDKLYFFGGSTGECYTNTTHEYHLPSKTWKTIITTGQIPSPRSHHTANIIEDSMVVVGGGNFPRPSFQNELLEVFKLNLNTLEWSILEVTGPRPSSRAAHVTEYDVQSGRLFVGCGFDQNLQRMEDFYTLDLNSTISGWNRITHSYFCSPTQRAFGASCLSDGAIWVVGGSDGSALSNDLWQYKYQATPPSLRTLASLKVLTSTDMRYQISRYRDVPLEVKRELLHY